MAGITRSSSSASLDLGPGTGLDPADVEQVGSLVHQRSARRKKASRS